jgi:hypothetical protein
VLPRSLAGQFNIRHAQLIEGASCRISDLIIRLHFGKLDAIGRVNIIPQFCLSLDETGFRASKSDHTKSSKVIVYVEFGPASVFKDSTDSHFVTGVCEISATDPVLNPASLQNVRRIIQRLIGARTSRMYEGTHVP